MGLLLHFWLSKLNKQNCLAKFSNFMRFLRNVRALKSHKERKRERQAQRERERDNEIGGCSALFMNRLRERGRERERGGCAYFWQNCNAIAELAVWRSMPAACHDRQAVHSSLSLPLSPTLCTLANFVSILVANLLRIVAKNTRNSIRIG